MTYRMAGDSQRDQLTGTNQLLLSIYIYIYPTASLDKIAIFIHSNGGDIYARPLISEQCRALDLTWKQAIKESYDTFYIASVQVLHWYKTLTLLLGAHTQPVHRLIDIDET